MNFVVKVRWGTIENIRAGSGNEGHHIFIYFTFSTIMNQYTDINQKERTRFDCNGIAMETFTGFDTETKLRM